MAIIKEVIEINGIKYDHTYSDMDMMIECNGVLYNDALDCYDTSNVYTETDKPNSRGKEPV